VVSALLLDTSAVIGLLERKTPSLKRVIEEETLPIRVSVITLGELHHGVEGSPDPVTRQRRRTSLDALKMSCVTVEITEAETLVYGDLSARLRSAGFGPRRVGAADRWISATAIKRGFTLVTQDAVLADALSNLGYGDNLTLCE
jgi:predicted nucleic acid-binding protein